MLRLTRYPFFVTLMGISGLAMLGPGIMALQSGLSGTAEAFLFTGLVLLAVTVMLAIAMAGYRPANIARSHLITLVAAYLGLPALFALPFQQAIGDTTWANAYFEMVSAFTTTGGTTYAPDRLDGALHLWRASVGWLGGLFVWITAMAIFAPLNLGGFEVTADAEPGRGVGGSSTLLPDFETSVRLVRVTAQMVPVYAGLTIVLWICLIIAGDQPLIGLIHSMSTLSTSGITISHGPAAAQSGLSGEILVALFMIFALSRRAYATDAVLRTTARLADDPEVRVSALIVGGATAVLFARHFVGALDAGAGTGSAQALDALWGTVFTVLSFLTTTGFTSANWAEAQAWSALDTPGLVLVGLAVIGGGVATTAGGVKLLRVWALYVHGSRELSRLLHPSAISGTGRPGREVHSRGAFIAWLFFMLFALTIAGIWTALSIIGHDFEQAMLLTVSGLSTTGPLASAASGGAVTFAGLGQATQTVLIVAMVLGRLETLAIVALLNRDLWRG